MLKDEKNNEFFIYLGKNVPVEYYKLALLSAEIDADEEPHGNVS